MKWIIYLVLICSLFDIVILRHYINGKEDVAFLGYFLFFIFLIIDYTIFIVSYIKRGEL